LPEKLRSLEIIANDAFSTYRSLYYEGGSLSSVYLWDMSLDKEDLDGRGNCFGAAVLIRKEAIAGETLRDGAWNSIHVIEVSPSNTGSEGESSKPSSPNNSYNYRLVATIILHLDTNVASLDQMVLSGSITRQSEQTLTVAHENDHIANMGRMIEEMEGRMRSSLQEIYFGKTHDLVNEIRPIVPAGFLRHQASLQQEMLNRLHPKSTIEES